MQTFIISRDFWSFLPWHGIQDCFWNYFDVTSKHSYFSVPSVIDVKRAYGCDFVILIT